MPIFFPLVIFNHPYDITRLRFLNFLLWFPLPLSYWNFLLGYLRFLHCCFSFLFIISLLRIIYTNWRFCLVLLFGLHWSFFVYRFDFLLWRAINLYSKIFITSNILFHSLINLFLFFFARTIIYIAKSLARDPEKISNCLVSCDYLDLSGVGELEEKLVCFHLDIFLLVLFVKRAYWELHLWAILCKFAKLGASNK